MNILPASTSTPAITAPPPAWPASSPPHLPATVETCETAGILATTVNLAASIQVTEALKYPHRPASRSCAATLLSLRPLDQPPLGEISTSTPDPSCPVCATRESSPTSPARAARTLPSAVATPSRSTSTHRPSRPPRHCTPRLRRQPDGNRPSRHDGLLLRFERGAPHHYPLSPTVVRSFKEPPIPSVARSLYARFIGLLIRPRSSRFQFVRPSHVPPSPNLSSPKPVFTQGLTRSS